MSERWPGRPAKLDEPEDAELGGVETELPSEEVAEEEELPKWDASWSRDRRFALQR